MSTSDSLHEHEGTAGQGCEAFKRPGSVSPKVNFTIDILRNIILFCDFPTKKTLALTNRVMYIHLFRNIKLRAAQDLSDFIRFSKTPELTDLKRQKLNTIRKFTFEPSLYCGWPCRAAYANVLQLTRIPSVDADGVPLFPTLKTATLNLDASCSGHSICRSEGSINAWPTPSELSLLANVETLFATEVCFRAGHDLSSIFRMLHMRRVEEVHVYFKNVCDLPSGLATQLKSLESTKKIHVHLEWPVSDPTLSDPSAICEVCAPELLAMINEFARQKQDFPVLESLVFIYPSPYLEITRAMVHNSLHESGNLRGNDLAWIEDRLQWMTDV